MWAEMLGFLQRRFSFNSCSLKAKYRGRDGTGRRREDRAAGGPGPAAGAAGAAGASGMRRSLPGQPAAAAGHARGHRGAASEFLQSLTPLPF